MSRNPGRVDPNPRSVLAVADPEVVVAMTERELEKIDIDRLCGLLVRSERSLALVNRRAFAAALADVPLEDAHKLPPAPPFAEAVEIARAEGKLLERTRAFLAQNPRALEELTPELTVALLRHFDPSMRIRREFSVADFPTYRLIGLVVVLMVTTAVVIGVAVHRMDRTLYAGGVKPASPSSVKVAAVRRAAVPAPRVAADTAVAPSSAATAVATTPAASVTAAAVLPSAAPVSVATPAVILRAKEKIPAPAAHVAGKPLVAHDHNGSLFVNTAASASADGSVAPSTAPTAGAEAAAQPAAGTSATTPAPSAQASSAPATAVADGRDALAEDTVLRAIVATEPANHVDWIRSDRHGDATTVNAQVRRGSSTVLETYHVDQSGVVPQILNHEVTTP